MKIIILSDIEGKEETIIPYALRFATHVETDVDIYHSIDPRGTHGTSSAFADSTSVAPGGKLSHDRILEREKHQAQMALQKYISGEGSRLNYPLKIDTRVETGNLLKNVRKVVDENPGSVVMATMKPGNTMIMELGELMELVKTLDSMVFLIPPGYAFKTPEKMILLTDFRNTSSSSVKQIVNWLKPFRTKILACWIAENKESLSRESESAAWKKTVESFIEPPMMVKTSVLDSDQASDGLTGFTRRNNPDLVFLPRDSMENGPVPLFPNKKAKKLFEDLGRPVVLY